MTQGMLEGITGSIGESDNEIGGLIQTRLTSAVSPKTALAAVFTWNGTTTVTTPSTAEVEIGDWISLDSDGQLFQIINLTINTSVEIDNPTGYAIPSGSGGSSKATRVLPVESALDWDEEGKVGLGGVAYYYASRTDTELQGITHVSGGVFTVGVKRVHNVEAPVVNLNRRKSAVDLARRAMLVAYAEGDDLNALGRNLGVNRLPFLASDDVFREIVQALAYNPKGTVFGLELALDALVGPGNYEIIEDLVQFPCTVFIKLVGAATTDTKSEGKTYLTGPEYQPPTSDTTFAIDVPILSRGALGSARWKPENLLTSCRLNYPSAHFIEEYDGDIAHAAWVLQGTGVVEGTDITLTGNETEFTNPAPTDTSLYRRQLRIQPESRAYAGALVTIPTGAAVDAAIVTGMLLEDGQQTCNVGIQADTAGTFKVGIVSGGAFVTGGTQLQRDTYYEVVLRKQGTDNWELYIDGALVESVPYTGSLPTFGNYHMVIGHFATAASSNKLRIKQLAIWVYTHTDYWTARGTGSVATANPMRLTTGASIFQAGDVGKVVEVLNSGTTNPQNGNNNGRYLVDSYLSGTQVELAGPVQENATVQAANPLRVTVDTAGPLFQFPDDLGKELVISGSILGNNASCTIDKLLQQGTLTDLESFATVVPEKTNVCEVIINVGPGGFTTEAGLNWQVNPQFVTESPIDWELADAGSWVGTSVTLRQALPLSASDCYRVLEVLYSNVLSAQILKNSLIDNEVIQEFPDLLFSYYPFYIADPLGFVRTYADAITAAGVIPDFLVD